MGHILVILSVNFHAELTEFQFPVLPVQDKPVRLCVFLKFFKILFLRDRKRVRKRDQHGIFIQNGNGDQCRIILDRQPRVGIHRQKKIPGELFQVVPNRFQQHCCQIVDVF